MHYLLLVAGSLAGLAAAVGVLVLFALALSMRRDRQELRTSLARNDREELESFLGLKPKRDSATWGFSSLDLGARR